MSFTDDEILALDDYMRGYHHSHWDEVPMMGAILTLLISAEKIRARRAAADTGARPIVR